MFSKLLFYPFYFFIILQVSPIYFQNYNFRSNFYFYLQISPIFTFLQISPLVLFFAERSLSQNSVQVPRGPSKSRWRISIGPKAHMAAYKRPATAQVKKRPQNACHITKTQKISRTQRTIPQTLTFPEPNSVRFKQIPWNSW